MRQNSYTICEKKHFKGKEEPFRITKSFYSIERQRIKDRKIIIKREIKKLFFKPVTVSIEIDDMDKFEQKGMKNKKPIMKILV